MAGGQIDPQMAAQLSSQLLAQGGANVPPQSRGYMSSGLGRFGGHLPGLGQAPRPSNMVYTPQSAGEYRPTLATQSAASGLIGRSPSQPQPQYGSFAPEVRGPPPGPPPYLPSDPQMAAQLAGVPAAFGGLQGVAQHLQGVPQYRDPAGRYYWDNPSAWWSNPGGA